MRQFKNLFQKKTTYYIIDLKEKMVTTTVFVRKCWIILTIMSVAMLTRYEGWSSSSGCGWVLVGADQVLVKDSNPSTNNAATSVSSAQESTTSSATTSTSLAGDGTSSSPTESKQTEIKRVDMFERIYNMVEIGYIHPINVNYILDVGAFQAEFSSTLRDSGKFPNAQYLLIEANNRYESLYQSLDFPYVITLVGDVDEEVVQYYRADPTITSIETGNSIFKEETRFFDHALVEERVSYTIDTILDMLGLSEEIFQIIKLDVQGSELKAIRGAKRLLTRSAMEVVVITEVSFVPYNGIHSPTFFELMLEMEQMNFKMVDIVGYSEASFDDIKGKMPIQFDVAWMHHDRIGWRNKKWNTKDYVVNITHST